MKSECLSLWPMMTMLLAVARGMDCPMCLYGPETIPDPDRVIADPSRAPANTCGFLDNSGRSFVREGTDFCQGVRAVATRCGCNIPPNACHLCWDESNITQPEVLFPEYEATDYIPITAPGIFFTCENLQAYLHTIDKDNPQCSSFQLDAGERCGCPRHPSNNDEDADDKGNETETVETIPPQEPVETPPPGEPCKICMDGQPVPFADKPLELGDLPIASCADLETFAGLVLDGTFNCAGLQLMGQYCGCPVEPGSCTLCPNGESVPFKDQRLNWFDNFIGSVPEAFESIGDSVTCEIMQSITAGAAADLFGVDDGVLCWSNQMRSGICGCSPGAYAIALTWVCRLCGILSFVVSCPASSCIRMLRKLNIHLFFFQGSLLIIIHILKRRRQNHFTVYQQLVLGLSFFDIVGSIAYILVGVMNPVSAGVYEAAGNDTTCRMQAVMILLNLTSMFYNMCLATYFFLIINLNWKERRFRRLLRYVHPAVIVLGTALAFASIPWAGPHGYLTGVCAHQKPPSIPTDVPLTLLLTTPIAVVLFVMNVTTVAICYKVYLQEVKARRWMAKKDLARTRRVFWQSFLYVMAFNVTQPVLLVRNYLRNNSRLESEALTMTIAILAPSQGFLNCFIYFQRSRSPPSRKKKDRQKDVPRWRRWLSFQQPSLPTHTASSATDSAMISQATAVANEDWSNRGDQAAAVDGFAAAKAKIYAEAATRYQDNKSSYDSDNGSDDDDDDDDNNSNDNSKVDKDGCSNKSENSNDSNDVDLEDYGSDKEEESCDANNDHNNRLQQSTMQENDFSSPFDAVAEFWRLNRMDDGDSSGLDDSDHIVVPNHRGGRRRAFRSSSLVVVGSSRDLARPRRASLFSSKRIDMNTTT